MDVAYVDELDEDNDGVKYLLVRRELFERNVYAKGMKTKDSEESAPAFLTKITKNNRPKKIWVDKRKELSGGFKNIRKAHGVQSCFRLNETMAAFAERTK